MDQQPAGSFIKLTKLKMLAGHFCKQALMGGKGCSVSVHPLNTRLKIQLCYLVKFVFE